MEQNNLKNKKDIVVLFGGDPAEYDVSMQSMNNIKTQLEQCGYNPLCIDVADNFVDQISKYKNCLVINTCHGSIGENGSAQAIMDYYNIQYTTSGVTASAIAIDKLMTKSIAQSVGITCPVGRVIDASSFDNIAYDIDIMDYPLVLKPRYGGSSADIYVLHCNEELYALDWNKFNFNKDYMIESYIKGQEISVLIMFGQSVALCIIDNGESDFFSYEKKYCDKSENYVMHQSWDINSTSHIKACNDAQSIFNHIGCRGIARMDFIIDNQSHYPYLLEINTQPGFSDTSFFHKFVSKHYSYDKFFAELINKSSI